VRCPRCGNENPESNRFCGMCGTTLLQAPATAAVGHGQAQAPVPRNGAESMATAAPAPPAGKATPPPAAPAGPTVPVISGPSFLGLNQPASQSARRRPGLSIDPHSSPSSSNLDYLLEDEEEPGGGGAWKFILIVVALALAVGFGYLRWKHQGLGWLLSGTKSAPAATQTSEPPESTTPPPPSSGDGTTSTPAAIPTATAGSQPAATSSTAPSSAAPASANNPASSTPASSAPPPPPTNPTSTPTNSAATPASSSPGDAAKSEPAAPATAAPPTATPSPAAPSTATEDTSPATSDAAPEATAERPKDVPAKLTAKPTAPVRPAKVDPVAEAQKYLYGHGAQQDCERGLRLLKPAAAQSNPKAMIEMGALYSAGLCTPRDLPTAYRWFALALRKDPDNQAVQTDLQKLWGEMTQPERQLAIRLSQ